jgi:glycogen synthase
MLPHEVEDVRTIESLTGVGFSELYHRHLAPQVHAAAELLRATRDAGMELDRARLRTEWSIAASADDLAALYREESELTLGE